MRVSHTLGSRLQWCPCISSRISCPEPINNRVYIRMHCSRTKSDYQSVLYIFYAIWLESLFKKHIGFSTMYNAICFKVRLYLGVLCVQQILGRFLFNQCIITESNISINKFLKQNWKLIWVRKKSTVIAVGMQIKKCILMLTESTANDSFDKRFDLRKKEQYSLKIEFCKTLNLFLINYLFQKKCFELKSGVQQWISIDICIFQSSPSDHLFFVYKNWVGSAVFHNF